MQVIFGSSTPMEFLTFIGDMSPTTSPFQIDVTFTPKSVPSLHALGLLLIAARVL
jgi:hypothetical protein